MFHIDHLSKCNRLSHLNSQIWKSRNQIWKTRQNFSFQKSLPRLGFGSLVLLPFNPFCPACYLHWRWMRYSTSNMCCSTMDTKYYNIAALLHQYNYITLDFGWVRYWTWNMRSSTLDKKHWYNTTFQLTLYEVLEGHALVHCPLIRNSSPSQTSCCQRREGDQHVKINGWVSKMFSPVHHSQ